MKADVEQEWIKLATGYCTDENIVAECFKEIHDQYSAAGRYYHTLTHLAQLLELLNQYQKEISQKDILAFAIFYHDIIYSTVSKNNEQKSAVLAAKRLKILEVPASMIEAIYDFIKATETHEVIMSPYADDLALFLDFDMSILGSDWDEYVIYTGNVRKEYSLYPNVLYKKGRKQFLEHTLAKPQIFHTQIFQTKLEARARSNMQREIGLL